MTSRTRLAAALLAAFVLGACDGVVAPGERAQEKVLFVRYATAAPRYLSWNSPAGLSLDSVDIYRVNADGTGLQNLTSYPARYGGVRASPDGSRVLFESDRAGAAGTTYTHLWVMNSDGTGLKELTARTSRNGRWSPDGSRIAFEMVGADDRLHVHVMNADGSNPQKVSEPAMQVGGGSCDATVHTRIELVGWIGNGRVGFARGYCGFGYRYFIVNADGSGFAQTDIKLRDVHWSPDGTRILYTRFDGTSVRVMVMNADGTGARVLSTQGNQQGLPSTGIRQSHSPWSPDGRRIMFFADVSTTPVAPYFCNGSALPYVVNVDGSGVRRLLDTCKGFFNGWSPSGDQVAFTLWPESGPPDVYAVKADGTGKVNLTGSPVWEADAEWLPRR